MIRQLLDYGCFDISWNSIAILDQNETNRETQENKLYHLYIRLYSCPFGLAIWGIFLLDCKTVRFFAYSNTREQSNQRSGMRLITESETGERRASHTRRACEARVLPARKTLTPRFTDFFTDFEKKTDCFAVYFFCIDISKFECRISQFTHP